MIELSEDTNWFLNISNKELTLKNIKTPLYLTEHIEYIKYMMKEGKYENSKGINEFYLSQIKIDPNSYIFGLQNNPEEDDLENLEMYLSHKRQLKFKSHESWGKFYTKSEIIRIVSEHKMWYITEADFMKPFYKQYNYDGFITEENAGYEKPFENICMLNNNKIISIEALSIPEELEHFTEKLKKEKFAFLRVDELGIDAKISDDINEFKEFNHYGFVPNKKNFEELKRDGVTGWTGNDVWYYIIQHDTWSYMNFDLDIKIEN
jgi:hypothetical protein